MRRAPSLRGEAPTGTATAYAGWRGLVAREIGFSARAHEIEVLDDGRLHVDHWFASLRGTVKDLAQLNYSARRLSSMDRLRSLRLYLGRPFRWSDRFLVRVIAMKSRRIAAHTAKHRL